MEDKLVLEGDFEYGYDDYDCDFEMIGGKDFINTVSDFLGEPDEIYSGIREGRTIYKNIRITIERMVNWPRKIYKMDSILWKSNGRAVWESPYYTDEYEVISSPYYATGVYIFERKEQKKEPKPKWWKCDFCSSTNLPEERKCEHCNAPRVTLSDKQKASAWGVNSNFVVKSHEIDWKDKVLERLSRLWIFLKSLF